MSRQEPYVVTGPFQGIVDNIPRPWKPRNSFDDLMNMLPWQGRLITRPPLLTAGAAPDGRIIRNIIPFLDVLGNQHNLAMTTLDAYAVTTGPVYNGPLLVPAYAGGTTYALNAMVYSGGATYVSLQDSNTGNTPVSSPTYWAPLNGSIVGTALPWGYSIVNDQVHLSNGSFPGLYWDGSANLQSEMHPGSWRFAMALAGHLVTAYTTEPAPQVPNSIVYPFRVRWDQSGSGGTEWDVSSGNTFTTAGVVDLYEINSGITALTALGSNGFVWGANNVLLMLPTGIGTAPFQFYDVVGAPKGKGNFYPYSMSVYGQICEFVSSDEIYQFDGSRFTPVGGAVKKLIFADIGTVSSPLSVYSWIEPRFGPNFPSLSYWLSLPSSAGDGAPVKWVHTWDDNQWYRFRSSAAQMTALGRMVL